MSGFDYKFFQIDPAVTESGFCLGLCGAECRTQIHVVMHGSHTASAPTGGGFYYYGIAHLVRQFKCIRILIESTVGTGHCRHTRLGRQLAGLDLVAEQLHRLNRRADECDPAFAAYLGKIYVLGQEAVARMNCLYVGNLGGTYYTRDIQVTAGAVGRPDTNCLICELKVWSIFVGLGINRHRFDIKLMTGADDTQCYFAAVCYQDF
jgi:hypothetical protein